MRKKEDVKKMLDYYLKLNYKTEIIPIPKKEGGGFEASIPQLGRYAFVGQGETPQEALEDLHETKKEYFEEFIEKGIKIPEPEEEKKEFRGEVLVRMPKFVHKELYMAAKENGISLNQYINILLTKNFQIYQVGQLITKCFQHFWENAWKTSKPITFSETVTITSLLEKGELIGA